MIITLKHVVQIAKDLYYQDFAPKDAYFDDMQFSFLFTTAFNDKINNQYKEQKLINKANSGFSYVEISPSWLISDTLTVTADKDNNEYVAKFNCRLFQFPWDAVSSSIQYVGNKKNDRGKFNRISIDDVWVHKSNHVPNTDVVFYYVSGKELRLINYSKSGGDEISIRYVPAIEFDDLDTPVPEEMVKELVPDILNLMFASRKGESIDKTPDGNPNTSQVSELNPDGK